MKSAVARIAAEALGLIVLQWLLTLWLIHTRLLEHLLSPGSRSSGPLIVTGAFLLLRTLVIVLLPGWVLARVWLQATKPITSGALAPTSPIPPRP